MTNEYQAVEIMESVKVRHQLSWFVQGKSTQLKVTQRQQPPVWTEKSILRRNGVKM